MSVRGYIKLLDSDGKRVYDEFSVDSVETVRATLTRVIDGTEAAYDVSSSSLTVYFRASVAGLTPIPVNVALSNVNTGTDGKVSGDVVFRRADFANAPQDVECAFVVVNTSVVDALTYSGNQETIWKGRWLAYLRGGMHEA